MGGGERWTGARSDLPESGDKRGRDWIVTMAVALSDGIHVAGTLARAGMLRPSRPDRAVRAIVGLHRFGPTMAAGIVGGAAMALAYDAARVTRDVDAMFKHLHLRQGRH